MRRLGILGCPWGEAVRARSRLLLGISTRSLLYALPAASTQQLRHHSRDILAAPSVHSFTSELRRLFIVQRCGSCVPRCSRETHASPIVHHRRRRLTEHYTTRHQPRPRASEVFLRVFTGPAICPRLEHDRLTLRVAAPPSSRLILEDSDTVTTARPVTVPSALP
jgi:hypothetical protein